MGSHSILHSGVHPVREVQHLRVQEGEGWGCVKRGRLWGTIPCLHQYGAAVVLLGCDAGPAAGKTTCNLWRHICHPAVPVTTVVETHCCLPARVDVQQCGHCCALRPETAWPPEGMHLAPPSNRRLLLLLPLLLPVLLSFL